MKRLEGIGGTDASCVMGAGFKTPYGLWEQKTNRAPDTFSNEAMRWGTELESVIRTRFAEETDRIVETVDPVRNPKADWWVGSPDGISFDKTMKTPGASKSKRPDSRMKNGANRAQIRCRQDTIYSASGTWFYYRLRFSTLPYCFRARTSRFSLYIKTKRY